MSQTFHQNGNSYCQASALTECVHAFVTFSSFGNRNHGGVNIWRSRPTRLTPQYKLPKVIEES
jgi:hypothetical protein